MIPQRRRLLMAMSLVLAAPAGPVLAQLAVWDPTNYVQNVLQAARALQQVNNQITSLQNEAQMLIAQAKNLASLPYSTLSVLQAQVARTKALLAEAQKLAYDVADIQKAFTQNYGSVSLSTSNADLVARADSRWATSVASFEDALKVQAGIVASLDADSTQMAALVEASQGASGALAAAQAGNQLLALQAQQLQQLTAVIAAQGRAEALEAADRAAARADAKARFARFMGKSQ
ncbi:P-type conjugative transfer protein TrbJ [Caulobacter flavus]|uniref:P-type conjugative transfer protein TrbJ n=1 Tax=Caulobacter flavus TaxID=1679497 RepID=A0A2N5CP78_9CAUL|nr:P-type conjugative transfer protein TrbJ [Caulobacter flavus]AYV48522.1 P-type conjugative transfer protein TrbJ [Caulobacter flavus]PLR08763.1 P-type conjugative transfer protein TrbJ [Caulobacter flavus]